MMEVVDDTEISRIPLKASRTKEGPEEEWFDASAVVDDDDRDDCSERSIYLVHSTSTVQTADEGRILEVVDEYVPLVAGLVVEPCSPLGRPKDFMADVTEGRDRLFLVTNHPDEFAYYWLELLVDERACVFLLPEEYIDRVIEAAKRLGLKTGVSQTPVAYVQVKCVVDGNTSQLSTAELKLTTDGGNKTVIWARTDEDAASIERKANRRIRKHLMDKAEEFYKLENDGGAKLSQIESDSSGAVKVELLRIATHSATERKPRKNENSSKREDGVDDGNELNDFNKAFDEHVFMCYPVCTATQRIIPSSPKVSLNLMMKGANLYNCEDSLKGLDQYKCGSFVQHTLQVLEQYKCNVMSSSDVSERELTTATDRTAAEGGQELVLSVEAGDMAAEEHESSMPTKSIPDQEASRTIRAAESFDRRLKDWFPSTPVPAELCEKITETFDGFKGGAQTERSSSPGVIATEEKQISEEPRGDKARLDTSLQDSNTEQSTLKMGGRNPSTSDDPESFSVTVDCLGENIQEFALRISETVESAKLELSPRLQSVANASASQRDDMGCNNGTEQAFDFDFWGSLNMFRGQEDQAKAASDLMVEQKTAATRSGGDVLDSTLQDEPKGSVALPGNEEKPQLRPQGLASDLTGQEVTQPSPSLPRAEEYVAARVDIEEGHQLTKPTQGINPVTKKEP